MDIKTRHEKALDDFVKLADVQPRNGRWPMMCAAIRTKLNDLDGAAKDRQRAIEIDKQNTRDIDLPIGRLTPERAETYGLDYEK